MSLTCYKNRRPVPHDFPIVVSILPSRHAIQQHYATGADTLDRWFRETGLPIPVYHRGAKYRPCAKCDNPVKRDSKTGLCLTHYLEDIRAAREAAVQPIKARVLVTDIMEHAAAVFGLTVNDIKGPSRLSHHVGARFAVCYIARTVAHLSYPRIAVAVGRKDHTAAIHACEKCQDYMARFPDYARKVATVRWLTDGGPRILPVPEPIITKQPEWLPPKPQRQRPERITITDGPEWWELSDDELIAQRIAEYRRAGGNFVEVY